MPSPVAHIALGCVIYRCFKDRLAEVAAKKIGPVSVLLLIAIFLSLLPDIDSVPGVLFGDFGRYHNNFSHSVLLGLFIAAAAAWPTRLTAGGSYRVWVLFVAVCYCSHVALDFLTLGRGVMAFWPLAGARFRSPLIIFYGLHWSEGILSISHIWTLLNELAFALILAMLVFAITLRSDRKSGS